jgi:hypothetical protein
MITWIEDVSDFRYIRKTISIFARKKKKPSINTRGRIVGYEVPIKETAGGYSQVVYYVTPEDNIGVYKSLMPTEAVLVKDLI